MFRRWLLRLSIPITKFLGKLHAPFSHTLTSFHDVEEAKKVVKPGMVLLSRSRGEFSNLFIPGFFTHAAIYCGNNDVIEAVGEGVRLTNLFDFVYHHDYVAILDPLFIDRTQKEQAANFAYDIIGCEYDYLFEPSNKAFYCSEAVLYVIQKASGNIYTFTKRQTLGVETVTPSDFWRAKNKFARIWVNEPTRNDCNDEA